MTTATPSTTPCKKVLLVPLSCVDMLNTLTSLRTCSAAKYAMTVFNSKGNYEKLAVVVYVLQNTQNVIILCCCFANDW